MRALIAAAAKLPGAEEGVACAGTALESRTLKIAGKAFAFFGPTDLRVKLSRSLPAAEKLARTKPGSCVPSAGGWTKCTLGPGMLPVSTLAKWISESYRLFAPPPYGDAKEVKPRQKKPAPTKRKRRG
ncbi:MAG: MmcQ/YjbR family DNA-binding protein [Myxococcales bacterium]|nr:MmcQ/YjbR family DNA-binding protein [Myxococcales bacterium]